MDIGFWHQGPLRSVFALFFLSVAIPLWGASECPTLLRKVLFHGVPTGIEEVVVVSSPHLPIVSPEEGFLFEVDEASGLSAGRTLAYYPSERERHSATALSGKFDFPKPGLPGQPPISGNGQWVALRSSDPTTPCLSVVSLRDSSIRIAVKDFDRSVAPLQCEASEVVLNQEGSYLAVLTRSRQLRIYHVNADQASASLVHLENHEQDVHSLVVAKGRLFYLEGAETGWLRAFSFPEKLGDSAHNLSRRKLPGEGIVWGIRGVQAEGQALVLGEEDGGVRTVLFSEDRFSDALPLNYPIRDAIFGHKSVALVGVSEWGSRSECLVSVWDSTHSWVVERIRIALPKGAQPVIDVRRIPGLPNAWVAAIVLREEDLNATFLHVLAFTDHGTVRWMATQRVRSSTSAVKLTSDAMGVFVYYVSPDAPTAPRSRLWRFTAKH
jgi:hypothetical protein